MESAFSKAITKAAGILVLFAIIAFFKWAISSIKKSNAEIKKNEALAKEKAKRDAERKKNIEFENEKTDIWVKLLDACYKTLGTYCKDRQEVVWIMENKIEPILDELAYKSQKDAVKQFELDGVIRGLGPFIFNKKQFSEWHNDFLSAKKKAEFDKSREQLRQDMERIRKENAAKKAESERLKEWEDYRNKFKKLNKAQQKNEIEWFKKKIVNNLAKNEDQKDEYIHELEMIALSD